MASGFTTIGDQYLIQDDLWSNQMKQMLEDDLFANKFVRMLPNFQATTIHIPSIGQAESADFAEGMAIKYRKLDEGEFTFTPDQYKYSAHSISEKFKRDSIYAPQVLAAFAPREYRALATAMETRIFNRMNAGQIASDLNVINGANHRFVASGTGGRLTFQDFAQAWYALQQANVPMNNLIAVLHPSAAYTFMTQTNVMNLLTPQPQWMDVVRSGVVTGMQFKFNIFGFDCYISNYLPTGITETINSVTVTSNGVTNFFFSASGEDMLPVVGVIKQSPTVYSEFNKDLQQTEHLTICEYGFKGGYRPENLVTILSSSNVIA